MEINTRRFLVLPLVILVAGCSLPGFKTPAPVDTPSRSAETVSSESETHAVQPTRNVSYMGTVGSLDASIHQQGTHMLMLSDGQFILMESTDANLNLDVYLGKHVEVRGSVQPTVEGGGAILRVEEITVLGGESDSSSSIASKMCGGIAAIPCEKGYRCIDNPEDSCDPLRGGADCGGICAPEVAVSSASSAGGEISSSASVSSSVKPVQPSSSASSLSSSSSSSSSSIASLGDPVTTQSSLEGQIVLMAKQKYDTSSLWSQKYCTSHVSFCIPAHKNWYFKSFGATTNNLWHVEFGMSAIDNLYQGPIVLNLVSGTSASMDAKDGQVKTQGSDVVGFKDWKDNTHFELIADTRLRDAVLYMIANITPFTPAE